MKILAVLANVLFLSASLLFGWHHPSSSTIVYKPFVASLSKTIKNQFPHLNAMKLKVFMKSKKSVWILLAFIAILSSVTDAQSTINPAWNHYNRLIDVPSLQQFRVQGHAIAMDSDSAEYSYNNNGDHLVAWVDNRELFQGTAAGTKIYAQFYNRNGQQIGTPNSFMILPQIDVAYPQAFGPDAQGNFYLLYISDSKKITLSQFRNDPPRVVFSRLITNPSSAVIYMRPIGVIVNDKIYLASMKGRIESPTSIVSMILNLDGSIFRGEQIIPVPGQGTSNINDAILAKDRNNDIYLFYQMQSSLYLLKILRDPWTISWNTNVDGPNAVVGDFVVDSQQSKIVLAWAKSEQINNRDTTNIFFSHYNAQSGQPTSPIIRLTESEWYQSKPDLLLSNEGLDLFYNGYRQNNAGADIFNIHLSPDGSIQNTRVTELFESSLAHTVAKHKDRLNVYYASGDLGHRALDRRYYQPAIQSANPRRAATTPMNLFAPRQKNQRYFLALAFSATVGIPLPGGLLFPLDPDSLFFISNLLITPQMGYLSQAGEARVNLQLPGTVPEGIRFYAAFVTLTEDGAFTSASNALELITQL